MADVTLSSSAYPSPHPASHRAVALLTGARNLLTSSFLTEAASSANRSSHSLLPGHYELSDKPQDHHDAPQDGQQSTPPPSKPRSWLAWARAHWILLSAILTVCLLAIIVPIAAVLGTRAAHPHHAAADTHTPHTPHSPGSPNAASGEDGGAGAVSYLPSYALAVRTPYVSTWLPGRYASDVTKGQPEFWNGELLRWGVLARVSKAGSSHGQTYSLFGTPDSHSGVKAATQKGAPNSTSTHTTITLDAGAATFTLDFFSPVSPKNFARQSLPYSYLTVSVTASSSSDIQILSAIDGAWTGRPEKARGNLTTSNSINIFEVHNPDAALFSENIDQDQALWGTTMFASRSSGSGDKLSSACANDTDLYSQFTNGGSISGTNCGQGYMYGHAHSLSSVSGSSKQVMFAVGLYQEDAIDYLEQIQTPYFRAQYPDIPSSTLAFLNDYSSALAESQRLDSAIVKAGNAVSTNYTDILEASVRQAFAASIITIPKASMSTADKDTNIFVKEISSDGNIQTIDVIYPTFPIYYVMAPDYLRLTMQPVFSYLATPSGVWNLSQVPHDMGDHYPNATGHNDNMLEKFGPREEIMPIESTGQAIHMLLAYAKKTGDFAFPRQYSGASGKHLLTTYGDALVANGTFPEKQLTTVDALPERANTTQLTITAAIGVSAVGALLGLDNYTSAGAQMTQRILKDGRSIGAITPNGSFLTYDYQHTDQFSVNFALFADKLLNMGGGNSFEPVYGMQSAFYGSLLDQYSWGLPYSSLAPWAIIDWNLWSAPLCSADVSTRIVDTTHRFLYSGKSQVPFGTKYVVEGANQGKWVGNRARSTVGANFAILAANGVDITY